MIRLDKVEIKLENSFIQLTKHLGEESYWIIREDSHDTAPWSLHYVPQYGGEEQLVDWFPNRNEALEKAKWVEENYT